MYWAKIGFLVQKLYFFDFLPIYLKPLKISIETFLNDKFVDFWVIMTPVQRFLRVMEKNWNGCGNIYLSIFLLTHSQIF